MSIALLASHSQRNRAFSQIFTDWAVNRQGQR
jgi:hypothetical protein